MNWAAGLFRFDNLSIFVGGFIAFFSLLIILYSSGFMRSEKGLIRYYLYIILTLITSLIVVFSNNLVLFVVGWGLSGLLLYLLIGFGSQERTSSTAKKAFIIIGGTDALMLLGLAFIWHLTGTVEMDKISLTLNNNKAVWAYLCLAAAAFAKAGAMPFHTWVPDTAEDALTPVTAYLPASLDKLLGIYLLVRISGDIFQMNTAINTFLMVVGSFTIVAAAMMALIQHDLKRLLGYPSQVGYMVLGIGTGTPVGIAGGLFHMVNIAICKACLFLSGGAVEKRAGTTNLGKLGGLAKIMPISFVTFLIASLAISGVPPFNGFASKWMVYQGIIETARNGGYLWVLWLMAAMFGSALTLAIFMKLIHAVFLGQPSKEVQKTQEVGRTLWIPTVILAALCVIFGVFAYQVPLKLFILPSLGQEVTFLGIWSPTLATSLLLAGVAVGVAIYLLGRIIRTREADAFVGGEILKDHANMRVAGTEFYDTIKDIAPLGAIYRLAERKTFDIYDAGSKVTFGFNKVLSYIHSGILPTYLAWCLLGMLVLFFLLR